MNFKFKNIQNKIIRTNIIFELNLKCYNYFLNKKIEKMPGENKSEEEKKKEDKK